MKFFILIYLMLSFGPFSWGVRTLKEVKMLFIGNSYIYLPEIGEPENPALPKMIKEIASSIGSSFTVNYLFHTPGGYSFERHFNDSKSLELLGKKFDYIILQGQSIESLMLTPWWEQQGMLGVKSFSVYLPKVLDLAFQNNSNVVLYVNWGWASKNSLLQEDHPGLYFPQGTPQAGLKWCGKDKFEYQQLINESYRVHTAKYPVKLSYVGSAWLALQKNNIVSEDELYLPDDWSHPSQLGAFVAALILTRDILGLDISLNKYFPEGIDLRKAFMIQNFLAKWNIEK